MLSVTIGVAGTGREKEDILAAKAFVDLRVVAYQLSMDLGQRPGVLTIAPCVIGLYSSPVYALCGTSFLMMAALEDS